MNTAVKLKVVTFHPSKKRKLILGDLAKAICQRKIERALDHQSRYENLVRDMVMRRLYHIAYSDKAWQQRSFPVELHEIVESNMTTTRGYKREQVDVLRAYTKVRDLVRQEGFNCEVEKEKFTKKDDTFAWGYVHLKVFGVAE